MERGSISAWLGGAWPHWRGSSSLASRLTSRQIMTSPQLVGASSWRAIPELLATVLAVGWVIASVKPLANRRGRLSSFPRSLKPASASCSAEGTFGHLRSTVAPTWQHFSPGQAAMLAFSASGIWLLVNR